MATLIGIVSQVAGQVFAVAGDGARRALIEGDRLFAGDQLVTGAEGAVAVKLQNGQELTLGRDSSVQMTAQLLAHQAPHVDTPEAVTPSQAQLTDVEQLQKAIAAGDDPTQTAEATAAGPVGTGGTGNAGGGHSFVLLEEVAGRVDPVIGFPTAGFNGIPEFPLGRIAGDPDNGGNGGGDQSPAIVPPNNPVSLTGLAVQGGELTLNEANLAQGSASDPAALTQSGTFSISAPDGLFSLSIGGINVISGGVVAGFPQSITTQLGNTLTITGYNPATGVVSYSYTLIGNEIHSAADGANSLSEQFTVVASDSNGDSTTGSLDINITDDVPKAFDDSNASTASESLLTLTGSVLPNDLQGADRVPTGPIIGGTFTGTYGTLVLAADGTYTYTLNTADPQFVALQGGGSGTETFTYTLTDADGDTSTATLVLQVHNNDDQVIIDGLNVEGSELTVYERNLGDGSSPNAAALTQSGTFSVSAADGLQTLTVGGISVVSGGVASGFPQSITTALGNTLTITGYNASTGVVSYSYTLVDNEAHDPGNGANSLSEHFPVVATDTDGSTTSGSLDVNVVDDLPSAANDSNAGSASESNLVLSGNVLSNDIQGADRVPTGPITAGTYIGTYGTLVLAADGTYTYTLNPNDPDFKGHGGGNDTDTFTYTITDADGDTSTAQLVLKVHNNDDQVTIDGLNVEGSELTVYERNLGDGSSPNAAALTQSGTFSVSAADGLQTLTVGGISVVSGGVASGFPQSITTALGNTLTITGYNASTGVVSYSYTLIDNETHPAGLGANNLSEHFPVVATDTDGSTANGSLDVNVVDDLPSAANDCNAGTASQSHLVLSGNVLSNDTQGADRVPTGPVTAGTYVGTYGTLVLAANGTYTYTLNPNDPDFKGHGGESDTDTFTYTITDADGDTSTAQLVLQVHNNIDPVIIKGLDIECGELTVFERNLSDGSHPNTPASTQNGTFTVIALNGVQTLTVGGINVVSGGVLAGLPQSITTALGSTLTITGVNASTGVVSYSYTLVDNETHPSGQGANGIAEHFNVVVTDTGGNTASGVIDVNIVDDLPSAANDSNTGTASQSHLVLSGNVLSNDTQGADRVPTGPVTAGTYVGTYGTLVLAANGTYTYTLNPNDPDFKGHGGESDTDTFTYTITDADGDTSTAKLVLQVHNNIDPVIIKGLDIECGELTVFERNLSDGSHPNTPALTQNGTFTVIALNGVQTLTVGGISVVSGGVLASVPQSITTALGSTLTITGVNASTGVVSYSYTLVDNETHPSAQGANGIAEHFNVVVTDTGGNTASGVIDVNIVDDLPSARADVASVAEGAVVSGNVLLNDGAGADGFSPSGAVIGVRAGSDTSTSVVGGLNSTIHGTYGYLTLDAAGNAVYHSNPKSVSPPGATDVFTYTVRDADGDKSTTTISIDVCDSGFKALNGQDVTVFEKALDLNKDGQDLAAGNLNPNAPPVVVDDPIIPQVLPNNPVVPGDELPADDSDANGDPLTTAPTTLNTGGAAKGAEFTATSLNTIAFSGAGDNNANQALNVTRASFNANTVAMTAVVIVSGYLGKVSGSNANDEGMISVDLKQGETLNPKHSLAAGDVGMEYSFNGGAFTAIGNNETFTAGADGTYRIHVTPIADGPGDSGAGLETYTLTMTVNYAGAHDITPDGHGAYSANDNHGGSDSAAVGISSQEGHTLAGTSGDDVLLAGSGDNLLNAGDGDDVLTAGSGNNTLHGEAGNDLLFSGTGNDLLDGGSGNDTVSYAHAPAGVTVDLNLLGAQNTGGAGSDTLTAIENLIGSSYNDTLTGDSNANIITGGLGNDVLNGGGGDDFLIGGPGNNSLTGGQGNDTFQWLHGNSGHDVVSDFTPGTDKLDLSQLLQGENATSASLDDYLHFKVTGSGASLVTSIDVSSTAGAIASQTIDLAGVNLASHYGVTPGTGGVIAGGADTATIINGMLNDHSLKVDTV
ncbi:retention module-containing protein [Pseudomonas fluorescens]|uniref:Type I secretion target n=1 Tax=Pseudomonas fluorescens TaxID=294 RepID=A0A5E7DD21_PSEFL|nr:retention module-containing protein [Pseudomonas fluorescens]VVO05402.1 hypothetical protein PS723_02985 [Pseudomonas fluorescens]